MIGALDPKEPGSNHVKLYEQHNIHAYSIDYLVIPTSSTLNVPAKMSALTGKLALHDAIKSRKTPAQHTIIIGYGIAGQAAHTESVAQSMQTTVRCTQEEQETILEKTGATAILIDKDASLKSTQQKLLNTIC